MCTRAVPHTRVHVDPPTATSSSKTHRPPLCNTPVGFDHQHVACNLENSPTIIAVPLRVRATGEEMLEAVSWLLIVAGLALEK